MTRYRVVIRAFTLRRDVASAYLLKRLLERKGCDVIIACSRNFVRILRFWRPHAVVINTVSQIERCAEIVPGTRIVFWPGEGAKDLRVSDAMMLSDQPKVYDMVDLYLLWGHTGERQYQELLPDKDHRAVVVCGNPKLDLVKFNPGLADAPASPKTIGFVGRFHHINRFNGVPTIYSLQLLNRREGVIWQVETFSCMISLIYRILDETDSRISIRPHPLEAPDGYSFMNKGPFMGRVEIDESLDMAAWAAQQSVIIAPSSTSLYEPYLLGVPIINMDGIHGNIETIQRLEPAAANLQEICHIPTNEGDAIAMIKRGIEPRPQLGGQVHSRMPQEIRNHLCWIVPAKVLKIDEYETAVALSQGVVKPEIRGTERPQGWIEIAGEVAAFTIDCGFRPPDRQTNGGLEFEP